METRESHEAIALKRDMRSVARACDDDRSVIILALTSPSGRALGGRASLREVLRRASDCLA